MQGGGEGTVGSSSGRRLQSVGTLAIAWWVAVNLRAVLLGVPPVLERIRVELGASHATVGAISALPLLVLGALALPGAWLVTRVGAHRTVSVGLAALAVGAALRAAPGGVWPLIAGTVILSGGIAIAQPALPVLLQGWFPRDVQRAATTFTIGLLFGETAGAGLTGPVLLPLTGGWRGTFIFWAVPALIGLALWRRVTPAETAPDVLTDRHGRTRRLLRTPALWWLTVIFFAQGIVYFTANTWTPTAAPGGPNGGPASFDLLVLNASLIPPTIALAFTRRSFVDSKVFYTGCSVLIFLGCVGWMLGSTELGPLWSIFIGVGGAGAFAASLAYPPTKVAPHDIAIFVGLAWTAGYCAAFAGPLLGGLIVDHTGSVRAPFGVVAAGAVLTVVGAWGLPRSPPVGGAPRSPEIENVEPIGTGRSASPLPSNP